MKNSHTLTLVKAGLLMAVLSITACKDEKVEPAGPLATPSEKTYYIVNEGNFSSGNGSISQQKFSAGSTQPAYLADLFQTVNNAALGSSVQSLKFFKGKGYITVQGNTGKVEIVDSASFSRQTTITSISAPQYLEPINTGKAYVTNWGTWSAPENEVAVLDLNSNTVTKRIPLNSNPTQMLRIGDEVWVAYASFANGASVSVINTQTDAVAAQINMDLATNFYSSPSAMAQDASGKVWVLCSGIEDFNDSTNNKAGALLKIDPVTRTILTAFPFTSKSAHPRHLVTSPDRTQLYYEYNGSVYKMPASATALPTAPLFTPQVAYFYGLSTSPATGNLYLADASFTGNSQVLVYSPTGQSLGTISSGVGTNNVVFK